ncbi:MAG: hypothetical protein OXT09_15560, partial [Myxococcales bacterium]|nr:hypothetical protein [Myxococcales bacterium]
MDSATDELLRVLETGSPDEQALSRVEALLARQRVPLAADGELATLADLSELLEDWAADGPAAVSARSLVLAASIAAVELSQAERAESLVSRALGRHPKVLQELAARMNGSDPSGPFERFLRARLPTRQPAPRGQADALAVAAAEAASAREDADAAERARAAAQRAAARATRDAKQARASRTDGEARATVG